jgi:pyruvate dehydrogenase E2 component (dihydrolipoamide acetyltransferase)
VVCDGQIVISEVMLLSRPFDDRIIDGHVGAASAYEIVGIWRILIDSCLK